jgi:starch-binding outer membrane protein, SusD/RagB family
MKHATDIISYRRAYVLLVCLITVFISCKKFIEVDPPADKLTTVTVFSNDESALAAIRGIYSDVMQSVNYIGNGGMSIFPALSADEIIRTSASATYDPFSNNALIATDFTLQSNIWAKGYYHIYHANAILENIAKSTNLSDKVKNQVMGEAKFIRAFMHFYLVNLFGPIPLVTSADYRTNAAIMRSDTSIVFQQIVDDLKDAQNLLIPEYPTSEKVRVNKWAATALLARVYLYKKDWSLAEGAADEVINSGVYDLATTSTVFVPNSPEAILQFMPPVSSPLNTAEGFAFVPFFATMIPGFILTDDLLASFEPDDARKTSWTKTSTVNNQTYTYPYKYKIALGAPGVSKAEYSMVLRLAEQYLVRAEARAQQGKVTGSNSAETDINIIRNRAALLPVGVLSQSDAFDAIEKERRIEFFTEWGHRWFDLKRWGKASSVLSVKKGSNWQPTDILYPIPQSEILTNSSLTQNPGY